MFVRKREGRPARVTDLSKETVQAWMDQMAESNLALSTMRVRQSTLSSLCSWLVKRESLADNPVAKLDRPRYERTPPNQVPNAELMDAVYTKGGKTRDIPLPSVVTKFLQKYPDALPRIRSVYWNRNWFYCSRPVPMYSRRTHSKVAAPIDAAASCSRYSLVVGLSQVGGDGNHSRLSTRNSGGGPNGALRSVNLGFTLAGEAAA